MVVGACLFTAELELQKNSIVMLSRYLLVIVSFHLQCRQTYFLLLISCINERWQISFRALLTSTDGFFVHCIRDFTILVGLIVL